MDTGPIGAVVAANIERVRRHRNLSYAELSRRLKDLGRPIAPLGLTRIRDLQRRVDVDDLIALSLALEVPPPMLLAPRTSAGSRDETVAVTESGPLYTREQVRRWTMGKSPIDAPAPAAERMYLGVKRGEQIVKVKPITDEDFDWLAGVKEWPFHGDD